MKKIILGLILGIFLQKTIRAANWYSYYHYRVECRSEGHESIKLSSCIANKQGLTRYIFIASGTYVRQFNFYKWVY